MRLEEEGKVTEDPACERFAALAHAAVFTLTVTVLGAFCLATRSEQPWLLWPTTAWGLGVIAHAAIAFARPRLVPARQRR